MRFLSCFLLLPCLSLAAEMMKENFETKCGHWEKTSNLHIDTSIFVGINKKTNQVKHLVNRHPCFGEATGKVEYDPSPAFKQNKELEKDLTSGNQDIEWTFVFAVSFRDENGKELNQDDIFYGYDPKKMHMDVKKCPSGAQKSAATNLPFKEHPFRFSKIHVAYKTKTLINVESTKCGNDNPEAWIAQPGIYRLVQENKSNKENFHFETMYYWPRIGQKFK